MLITPLDERLRQKGGTHLARWLASVERARELEAEGHLFHGTTSQAGQAILEEGFKPHHEGYVFHVYWGPLSYALSFADRGWNDPALLAAPLEAVLRGPPDGRRTGTIHMAGIHSRVRMHAHP